MVWYYTLIPPATGRIHTHTVCLRTAGLFHNLQSSKVLIKFSGPSSRLPFFSTSPAVQSSPVQSSPTHIHTVRTK